MEKKVKNHEADMNNKNLKTPGQNITVKKNQENTRKQIEAHKNVPQKHQPKPVEKKRVEIKTTEVRPTPKKKK